MASYISSILKGNNQGISASKFTANRVEKSTAFSSFQNPSQLCSLFPPPKFAVAPLSKMASLFKKKKSFDAFCVCEFCVDCFCVAVTHVSASAVEHCRCSGKPGCGYHQQIRSLVWVPSAPCSQKLPCFPRLFLPFFFCQQSSCPLCSFPPRHPCTGSHK